MLRIKLLRANSKVPTRSNPNDAGLDLYAAHSMLINPLHRAQILTGIAMAIPVGWYGRISPRSGLSWVNGINVMAGTVDSDYRGEVKVILLNSDMKKEHFISEGDRIAQIIIQRMELWEPIVVDDLDGTDRGDGGFGSTGR